MSNTPSSTDFPLQPDGPLCPLLRDGERLLEFYDGAGAKQEVKKFIKRNRWPGKPPLSYSVGAETLKKMLISLLDTPEGRARLQEKTGDLDNSAVLHQVMWNWLCLNNPKLVQAVDPHCETVDERVFLRPDGLSALLEERKGAEDREEDESTHLAYLVLAFGMLQPEDAAGLAGAFLTVDPSYAEPFGVS